MKQSYCCIIAILSLAIAGCNLQNVQSESSNKTSLSELELDLFSQWLTHSWDNIEQINAEITAGLATTDRHARYAMRYTEIQIPEISGRTFAIENYDDGNGFSGDLQRVSLHRFMLSESRSQIIHEILLIKDQDFRASLKNNIQKLANISNHDVIANKNCRLYWHWTGSRFEGKTKTGSCVTNSYSDTNILVEGSGILEKDRLVRHDRNFKMSGEEITRPGHKTGEIFLPVTVNNNH